MGQQALEGDAVGVLGKAVWAWSSFIAGIVLFGVIVLSLVGGDGFHGGFMFAVAAVWSLVAVPVMLVMKSHVLRSSWEARPADPETYFKGLLALWAVIEIGGVLALISCLTADAMLPGGLLAAGLLTLLVTLRPSTPARGGGMSVEPA